MSKTSTKPDRDPISGRLLIVPRIKDERYPFYSMVPKDPAKLLAFRRKVLAFGFASPRNADLIWTMCSRDLLFFVNVICWVFEPRSKTKNLPFNTYEYQDDCLKVMNGAIEDVLEGRKRSQDVGIEKSRDLGATWMLLVLFFWYWLFHELSCFGLVSKDGDSVDRTGDSSTLFWKLGYLAKNLPGFLQPAYTRSLMKLTNDDMAASIMGYTATGNVARSGRTLAFGMDELGAFDKGKGDDEAAMASVHFVTFVRFLISTYQGAVGAFYDAMRGKKSNIIKIRLHWSDHPDRVKGLYTSERGVLVKLRPEPLYAAEYAADYPYVLDGKVRSPYFDEEEARPGMTPARLAEELEMDPIAAGTPFFDPTLLKRLHEEVVRPPTLRGELHHDCETFEPTFVANEKGRLLLWLPLGGGLPLRPSPMLRAAVGCDISAGNAGSQTSNSTAIAVDNETGEQIAEFATNALRPDLFADWVVAFCKWLNGAYLNWEHNGPGGQNFTDRIIENGYRNIYYRKAKDRVTKITTPRPGWHSGENNKSEVLGRFLSAVHRDAFLIRSDALVSECAQYVYRDGNKVVHLASQSTSDHASKGESHGDRVIGAAVAWLARGDRKPERQEPGKQSWESLPDEQLPQGSLALRMRELDQQHEPQGTAIF